MDKKDYLLRGIACNDRFRFFMADTSQLVQQALNLHDLYPASALLLGRLLTGALLMGADLKDNGHSLTLNIDAEGSLKGAIAIYEPEGKLRGYAKNPQYYHEETALNSQIGKLLGSGTLNVIKDYKLKEPMVGTIELITGEVGEDIAHYYLRSEQIPTAVSLGVLFNREGSVLTAGGYLIQQMPNTDEADAEKLRQNLAQTPYITDLLDMGMDWQQILSKLIFKDMDWQILQEMPALYYCSCSKERFANALRLLQKEELESMSEGISPVCHYCNKTYDFSPDDIQAILATINTKDY